MKLIRDSWKTAKVKLIAGHLRSTIERERDFPGILRNRPHCVKPLRSLRGNFLSLLLARRADKDRVQTATRLLEVAPSPPSSNPLITGNRPRDRLLITDVGIEGELI